MDRHLDHYPQLPDGHHYSRTGYDGFTSYKTLLRVGSVAVHKVDGFAKPSWWVVDVVSGYGFGSFSQARHAKALCAALGERVEEYWARASQGDARAGTAIARLCRIHKSRAGRA
jgi:hypothetical protein